jgi:hypothetical protein
LGERESSKVSQDIELLKVITCPTKATSITAVTNILETALNIVTSKYNTRSIITAIIGDLVFCELK